MGKLVFKIFESQPYLAGHVTRTEKKPETQMEESFGNSEQCEYLTTIKLENVSYRFLEICIILEVMAS